MEDEVSSQGPKRNTLISAHQVPGMYPQDILRGGSAESHVPDEHNEAQKSRFRGQGHTASDNARF